MANGTRGGQRGNGACVCGWLVGAVLLVAMCALAPTPARAAGTTYYVGSTGDSITTTNCTSATNTTCTLRGAISVATSGSDTITFTAAAFPAGTPTAITLTSNTTLTPATSMTIDGTGHSVLIDGNCTVSMGVCTSGGTRVFNVNSSVTVAFTALTIQHARNGTYGPAIFNNGGTVTVTNSTFTGNFAASNGGAGIYNLDGTVSVVNSTFSGNTTSYGGGIVNFSGTLSVTNSTISGNTVSNTGGGIYNHGTLVLANTIVAGNTVPNGTEIYNGTVVTDNGHNLVQSASGNPFTAPGDITGTPALLAPLSNYGGSTQTMSPLPGSAAIGGGDPAVCANAPVSGVDQRGVARPPASCDIGAFQSQGFTFSALGGSPQSTPVGTAFPTPLTLTVSSSHSEPVVGGVVTFTGPSTGAGITGSPVTASITSTAGATTGTVSQSVTANATPGGLYSVVASTTGVPTSGAGGNVTFSLTNTQAPTITSASSTSVTAGATPAFTVTATGTPAPTFAATGLPMGVTLDPTSGALGGTTTVAGVYPVTLTASNGISPDATQMFTLTVNAAAAAKLTVVQQPTFTVAGATITPAVTVQVQDQYGNRVPTAGTGVTLALGMNPGMGTLAGALTQMTDASGLATFPDLRIAKAGAGYTLVASSGALTNATSSAFTVTPGSATRLVVAGIPASLALGAAGSVTVTAQDGFGNTATGYTGTIHVTSSDPGAMLPADYPFVARDAGTHTFTNGVMFHTAGGKSVTATDTVTSTITGSETGITVAQGTAAVGVTSSANPSSFGQRVTFTATVSGIAGTTPTGSVQFSFTPTGSMTSTPIGTPVMLAAGTGTAAGTATASIPTTALPAGSDTITATYSGDANFATSSGTANQTVTKAGTTMSVTAMPSTSTFGQSVTLTATVAVTPPGAGTPTGSVTFSVGGIALSSGTVNGMGVASLTTTAIPVGANQTVTATYSGDANFATSSGTVSVTVNPGTIIVTAPTGSGSGNSGTASAPSIRAGSSLTLGANPATVVRYTSSNPNIAVVDAVTGVVTGIAPGSVTITVSGPNGSSGSITLVVSGDTGGGLIAPAPMARPGGMASTAGAGATPRAAPTRKVDATGTGSGGSVQPQVTGGTATGTATPEGQPIRR